MKKLKKLIGQRIKARRKECGYRTQADFAEALETDQATVGRWEAGIHTPNEFYLKRIYKLLDINESDLTEPERSSQSLEYLWEIIRRQESDINSMHRQLKAIPADILSRLNDVEDSDWESFRALMNWPQPPKSKRQTS